MADTKNDSNNECIITERLFDPDRKLRKDLWKFIKLVAPTKQKKKWKTKEAVGAYCIKCASEINYSSGTSQQILRHMERYHPDDIDEPTKQSSKKQATQQLTIQQVAKKLKFEDSDEISSITCDEKEKAGENYIEKLEKVLAEKRLLIVKERARMRREEHEMNMRLKEIELKREEMRVRMDVLKMRIELKKGDPTISKEELETFLPLP